MTDDRQLEPPATRTVAWCSTCGRERPPAWTDHEKLCHGAWWTNVGTSDHTPTPFRDLTYVLETTDG